MAFLSAFVIRLMWPHKMSLEKLPPFLFFFFWKSFGKISINLSLNVWQNAPVYLSDPELLFAGRFLVMILYP